MCSRNSTAKSMPLPALDSIGVASMMSTLLFAAGGVQFPVEHGLARSPGSSMASSPGVSSPALFQARVYASLAKVHLDVGMLPKGALEDSELVRGLLQVPHDIHVVQKCIQSAGGVKIVARLLHKQGSPCSPPSPCGPHAQSSVCKLRRFFIRPFGSLERPAAQKTRTGIAKQQAALSSTHRQQGRQHTLLNSNKVLILHVIGMQAFTWLKLGVGPSQGPNPCPSPLACTNAFAPHPADDLGNNT